MKSKKIGIVIGLALLLIFGIFLIVGMKGDTVVKSDFRFHTAEETKDGELIIRETMFGGEEGTYYVSGNWKCEEGGVLTAMQITSDKGEVLHTSMGDIFNMGSSELKLEEGTYKITLYFMTSIEAFEEFIEEAGLNRTNFYIDLDFANEADRVVSGSVIVKSGAFGGAVNKYMLGGILIGLVGGVILVVLLLISSTNDGRLKREYDERQEVVRGRGFKYGFFTIMICNGLYGLLASSFEKQFVDVSVAMISCALIGIIVYVSYCIWNDGYFSINENPKRLVVIFVAVTVMNLLIFFMNALHGEVIVDGVVTFRIVNLLVAIMSFIVLGVLFLKKVVDKREDD